LLSAKYGANQERVELACWLHDISSLKSGNKQDHHIKGAQEAGEILSVLGCGVDDICSVQHSIRCHRGSNMGEQMSLEAAIVCTADAIANIGKPFLLSYFAFGVKGLDFENGLAAIRSKVVRSYDKIPGFLKGEAEASLRLWEQLGVL
jgi:HD superfamily phosphodiesterase